MKLVPADNGSGDNLVPRRNLLDHLAPQRFKSNPHLEIHRKSALLRHFVFLHHSGEYTSNHCPIFQGHLIHILEIIRSGCRLGQIICC